MPAGRPDLVRELAYFRVNPATGQPMVLSDLVEFVEFGDDNKAQLPGGVKVMLVEDGGVAVKYNCPRGCPELLNRLETVARRYPTPVILAPYPSMGHRIALTAWTRIDAFDEFDEARIVRFIDAYRGIDHHERTAFGG